MRLKYRLIFLPLFIFALVACQSSNLNKEHAAVQMAQIDAEISLPNANLDGLWRSDGYGHLYEIEGDSFQIYAVTAVSCVPTLSGEVLPGTAKPSTRGPLEAWLDIHILQEDGVSPIGVQVIPTENPDQKQFVVDGITTYMTLNRLHDWPETCKHPSPDTPLAAFDALWQTYDEHYPFFAMKGIDWYAVSDQYRPQINEQTTDAELLDIFTAMIEPLHDAHTWIQPIDLDDDFLGNRPDPNPLTEADWQRTEAIIADSFLQTPPKEYVNGEISFGLLARDVGYLRINRLADYAPKGGDYWTGMEALELALDEIFSQPMNGLIIDLRPNEGGSDLYGLAIVNRLTQAPYLAYTIEARNDPADPTQWTQGQEIFVQPSKRPGYHGPVILLTSRYTVSAGETFTMALMGRSPEVTRIGENTQGVFSVVLVHILPNGWWFGLQNERFLTVDGQTFDGPGIPPHIVSPVFTQDELTSGQDSGLEMALDVLAQQTAISSK